MDRNLTVGQHSTHSTLENSTVAYSLEYFILDTSVLTITEQIELYGSMTVIPIGLILNLVTLVTFYKCKTHKSATGLHLMYIAVADCIMLVGMFFMRSWLYSQFTAIPDFNLLNTALCKGISFINTFGQLFSAFLLASATVERFVSIAFALKVATWNLVLVSKFLIAFYFLLSISASGLMASIIEITMLVGAPSCSHSLEKVSLHKVATTVVFTVLANGICFGLIFIFTSLIAVKLYRSKQKRQALSQTNTTQKDKEFVISLMLFLIACMFIVLRFPAIIVYELLLYYSDKYVTNPQIIINLRAAWQISYFLIVVNHSFNFIIYIIFFKSFRDTLMKCLKLCCCQSKQERRERMQNVEARGTQPQTTSTDVSHSDSMKAVRQQERHWGVLGFCI